MYKTRKLKDRKHRQTKKTKNKIKRKIKNNSNKNYDFSKIHPASINI